MGVCGEPVQSKKQAIAPLPKADLNQIAANSARKSEVPQEKPESSKIPVEEKKPEPVPQPDNTVAESSKPVPQIKSNEVKDESSVNAVIYE